MKTTYAASTNPVKVWNSNQVGGPTPLKRPQPTPAPTPVSTGGRATAAIVSGYVNAAAIRVDPAGNGGHCGAKALKAAMEESSSQCPPQNSNSCYDHHRFQEQDLCDFSAQARMLPIIGALLGLLMGSSMGESFLQQMLSSAQNPAGQMPQSDFEPHQAPQWDIGGPPRGYPCQGHHAAACSPQPSFGCGERPAQSVEQFAASSASFTAFWGSMG